MGVPIPPGELADERGSSVGRTTHHGSYRPRRQDPEMQICGEARSPGDIRPVPGVFVVVNSLGELDETIHACFFATGLERFLFAARQSISGIILYPHLARLWPYPELEITP